MGRRQPFLTMICNVLTDLNLSDMEVRYKAFRTSVLKQLLRANRFDIEPELVIKSAKLRVRIYEVPITYHGRTYAEGKKIGWRDGVAALWRMFVFRKLGVDVRWLTVFCCDAVNVLSCLAAGQSAASAGARP